MHSHELNVYKRKPNENISEWRTVPAAYHVLYLILNYSSFYVGAVSQGYTKPTEVFFKIKKITKLTRHDTVLLKDVLLVATIPATLFQLYYIWQAKQQWKNLVFLVLKYCGFSNRNM